MVFTWKNWNLLLTIATTIEHTKTVPTYHFLPNTLNAISGAKSRHGTGYLETGGSGLSHVPSEELGLSLEFNPVMALARAR